MKSLRAVVSIPAVVAGLWAFALAISAVTGQVVARVAEAAMEGFSVVSDGHLLANLLLFAGDHRGTATTIFWSVLVAAAIAGLASMLTLAGVIARLRQSDGFFAAAGRHLPQMAAVHGMHLVVRVVLLAAVLISTGSLPAMVRWPAFALAYVYCTCALDTACINVVRDGASARRPWTALHPFVSLTSRPRVLAAALLVGLSKWAVVGLTAFVALRGMDDGSGVWGARLAVLVTLLISLWRLSILTLGAPGPRPAKAAAAAAPIPETPAAAAG